MSHFRMPRDFSAGLVVALLVGGFVVALHGRQGGTTKPLQPTTVVQFPTVPAPSTPHPPGQCAGDPETTAAIRPGGLGALSSTFPARWGGDAGVALGTTYFGRYHDTGMPIVGVPSTALGPNARVPNLTYHVDSTVHITLAQAQAIAATILPSDAHPISNGFGTPPPTAKPIADTYCSAAFWAAFPPGTPSFTHGELAVIYNLRSDGSVDSIDFSPAIIG